MANNVYIGSRYVPIFDGDWDNSKNYEALTIVLYSGSSYTSKKPVPAGTLPTDTTYWALTGNYNGQISYLQGQIDTLNADAVNWNDATDKINNFKIYNVLDYGAKGDGMTDDTAAISAAVTAVNVTGGTLYFPVGRYVVNGTFNFTHHAITVQGANQQATYILQQGDVTTFVFGDGLTKRVAMRVEHLSIINQYATPGNSTYGIEFLICANSTIDDVVVSECHVGIRWTESGNSFITNTGVISAHANAIGFDIGGRSVSTSMSNCYVGFYDNSADSGIGLAMTRGDIADFTLDYFDVGNGSVGVLINGLDSPANLPPTDIRLRNVVVDASRTACIEIADIPEGGSVNVLSGWLNPLKQAGSRGIYAHNAHNVVISNVVFQQLQNSAPTDIIAILLQNTDGITVSDCEFINLHSAFFLQDTNRTIITNNRSKLYAGQTSANNLMYATSSSYLTVTDNMFFGDYANAIYIDTGDKSIVKDNICEKAVTDNHSDKVVSDNLTA